MSNIYTNMEIITKISKNYYDDVKKLILNEINKHESTIIRKDSNHRKRPIIYTNEYYLNMIFYVLTNVVSWSSLLLLKEYKSESKYHYKTICNKYNKWCANGYFKNAFNNYKPTNSISNIFCIDATPINNKNGIENITLHVENKKKKNNKIISCIK